MIIIDPFESCLRKNKKAQQRKSKCPCSQKQSKGLISIVGNVASIGFDEEVDFSRGHDSCSMYNYVNILYIFYV